MSRSLLFRLQASGVHLLGSALVIGLFLWLVYGYWYVHPYQIVLSALDVVKILVGVDLVLGPLLTLIVFNIAKPRRELARDMGVILAIQLSALSWGVHVTYSMRPQIVAFLDQDVYVLTASDIDMTAIPPEISHRSLLSSPVAVYVKGPQTPEEIAQHVSDMFVNDKPDAPFQPERYRSFADNREKVHNGALRSEEIRKKSDMAAAWFDGLQGDKQLVFFNIHSGNYESLAAVDAETGVLVSVMPQ
jgi:hypothetical protein